MKGLRWLCLAAGALAACGPTSPAKHGDAGAGDADPDGELGCPRRCSDDQRTMLDCEDKVVQVCGATETCSITQNACLDACAAAQVDHRSVGCDYYAVHMDTLNPSYCFAVFLANTWTTPAKVSVSYPGTTLSVESFTRLPVGSGRSLTYAPYSAAAGIPPGQVALLFLDAPSGSTVPCPT